jgi:hypothetical protein
MVPNFELTTQQRKSATKLAKKYRSTLVEGAGDARPSFLWRTMAIGLKEDAEERGQRRVEILFRAISYFVVLCVVGLFIADAVRHDEHRQFTSMIFVHGTLAAVLFGVGVTLLTLLLIDVATYKPRLFAGCATASAEQFFTELSWLSDDLDEKLGTLKGASITTWQEHGEEVEGLLEVSNGFLLLDRLRRMITLRMLLRLTAIIGCLALIGYGLSGLLRHDVIHIAGYAKGLGLPEHLYFTVTSFFTVGFGDVIPTKDFSGYAYFAAIVSTFALVVYFVLTDVVASHGEFRVNIRAAATTLVVKESAL